MAPQTEKGVIDVCARARAPNNKREKF